MSDLVLLHGGAGAGEQRSELMKSYADRAFSIQTKHAVDIVCEGVRLLEEDPLFNAGTGSVKRIDGSIEMDAAVMYGTSIGAVSAIERVRNPILVARKVMEETPHVLLTGDGALKFARAMGFGDHDPSTPRTEEIWKKTVDFFNGKDVEMPDRYRNYYKYAKVLGFPEHKDTVGAVARVNGEFAAAVSTGGASPMMRGRVGDSPLPGSGFHAGPNGAVVATGIGEEIIKRMMCYDIYREIGKKPLQQVLDDKVAEFGEIHVGVIAVSKDEYASSTNAVMPVGVAKS